MSLNHSLLALALAAALTGCMSKSEDQSVAAAPSAFGLAGGIVAALANSVSTLLPPYFCTNATPLSGGASAPSSRLPPWQLAQLVS